MHASPIHFSACLLALAVTAALAGCGSSDPDSPDDTGAPAVPDGGAPVTPEDGSPTSPEPGGTPDTVEPGDGEPATAAFIDPDDYEDVLRRIITVANDEVLNDAAAAATPLFEIVGELVREAATNGAASGDGLTFVSSEPVDGGPYANFSFACDGGGTLVGNAYAADDAPGGPALERITTTEACIVGGTRYDGSALRRVRFVRGPDESTYDRFSVTRADGFSFTLDGSYTDTTPAGNLPANDFGWTDTDYTADENGSTTRIDGYTSRRGAVYGFIPSGDGETATVGEIPRDATARVTFSVTAPWSSGERLDVAVDLGLGESRYAFVPVSGGTSTENPDYPLSDLGSPLTLTDLDTGEQLIIGNPPLPDATQWQTGTLAISAAGGSRLVLSPETGDPATFSVAFDDDPDAVTRAWSDGFQVSCPQPIVCR